MKTYHNPVLSGFYPDPSVCRVGDDFYLVNSTFAVFPGVPVFHSRDLVNWTQIGHVLDRPSQLQLDGCAHSHGIFAPTLRYHAGVFYMVTTQVGGIGNFIVTATDPAGPWSDPYIVEGADGIDPSLFFDDDGRCWYTGTHGVPEGGAYYGDNEIYLQEIDLTTMQFTGGRYGLWRGADKHAIWAEGPHLYKKDGKYYLMIAEGGTGAEHAITMANSDTLTGPYTGCKRNPVFTHRHLGPQCDVINVGHGDLVQTAEGAWWMVCLASRPYGGRFTNLGRETFLVPVDWSEEWPWVAPETGRIPETLTLPEPDPMKPVLRTACEHFDQPELPMTWVTLRTPKAPFHSLVQRPGWLRLQVRPERMTELAQPSFLGIRQRHMSFTVSAAMEFNPVGAHETAGLVLIQNNAFQYRMEVRRGAEGKRCVAVVRCEKGEETVQASLDVGTGTLLKLAVQADQQHLSFFCAEAHGQWQTVLAGADGRILSTDVAGGFVGNLAGVFASSCGRPSENHADFDWFEYLPS